MHELDVVRHPRFPAAARTLARNMRDLVARDATLADVCKDAGRYVATMCAMRMHHDGALTLARLKEACVASGMLSAGRARAVLRYFESRGHLVPAPSETLVRRYAPAPPFEALWRAHLAAALEAACLVEPGAACTLARFDDGTVADLFSRLHHDELVGRTPHAPIVVPFLGFLHHYAASHLAWTLLGEGEADAPFPSCDEMRVTISGLARRFGVSRVHVRRLLDAGVRVGVLEWNGEGSLRIAASACEGIRLLYATQIAALIGAARAVPKPPA